MAILALNSLVAWLALFCTFMEISADSISDLNSVKTFMQTITNTAGQMVSAQNLPGIPNAALLTGPVSSHQLPRMMLLFCVADQSSTCRTPTSRQLVMKLLLWPPPRATLLSVEWVSRTAHPLTPSNVVHRLWPLQTVCQHYKRSKT
jgi:hypothetical protein